MISSALLTSCGVFQTKREPCNCGRAVEDLTHYTTMLHDCLEDKGNLRQQLKAAQEKK